MPFWDGETHKSYTERVKNNQRSWAEKLGTASDSTPTQQDRRNRMAEKVGHNLTNLTNNLTNLTKPISSKNSGQSFESICDGITSVIDFIGDLAQEINEYLSSKK